jgi:integrase/recombinase XerD
MNEIQKYWESSNDKISKETRSILNEYLLSLKLANKTEATITKYLWILEKFLSVSSISIKDLTSANVLDWLNSFSEDKSPKTIDLVLSCLSSFFKFCLEEDYMEKMVIKKRWRPRIPQALPRYLNEQEYARVKLVAENLSLRNRALILFFFSSGCRRQEVSDLNIEDINLDQRTAKVRGKGKKIRTVHFSEECALILMEYLRTRSYEETDPLFMNRKGLRLLPKGIYRVITTVGKKAGIKLHPHAMRHTFATNMMARGAEIEFLADEMGHANLNTTRIYARIPTEDMILAYQNKMG